MFDSTIVVWYENGEIPESRLFIIQLACVVPLVFDQLSTTDWSILIWWGKNYVSYWPGFYSIVSVHFKNHNNNGK